MAGHGVSDAVRGTVRRLGVVVVLVLIAAACGSRVAQAGDFSAPAPAGPSVSATGSAPATPSVPATGAVPATPSVPATFVVVIDAGHQGIVDRRLEPIGPGSKKKKPAVATGTRGRVTHVPEYKANLKVALKLRDVLEAQGVTVIMVRTKNHVDITNSKRAKIANAAHADLFIRLHCDGVSSHSTHGISVLTPGRNTWTRPIVARSLAAAKSVRRAIIKSTRAKDRGIVRRTDLAGFNWCKVPVVLVEMGFMTNATEDRRLATSAYQGKIAKGLARGIGDYLSNR
jgi:N-acetylmuramoyl-L-alanine amidase